MGRIGNGVAGLVAVACAALLILTGALAAEPGVSRALCGGSGLCVSHSAGLVLTSALGRCSGAHAVTRDAYPGKDAGAGDFTRSSAFSAREARAGLDASWPNPFNPSTSIRYSVKAGSRVTLRIFGVTGELVRTLVDGNVEAGEHTALWDGSNDRGVRASSGIYFIRLETEWGIFSRKAILAK